MLLSGPPAVGKTLTAESVAVVMRVPIYILSAGDLGTDPKEVEKKLPGHDHIMARDPTFRRSRRVPYCTNYSRSGA